jgi:uncharacterized protein (TIGR02588 family)
LSEGAGVVDHHGLEGKPNPNAHPAAPAIEWVAAAVGLLLTLGILGAMAWDAWVGGSGQVPSIEARVEQVIATPAGYVVKIILDNRSPATAAGVEVAGTVTKTDGTMSMSSATIDYVPGGSTRMAGLFFADKPEPGQLEVRVLGYAEP